ncbi:MAG TPA: sensor histidine kinase [Bacteroidia bacterium]
MSIFSRLHSFGNTGVKPSYLPWEIYLTRKLNLLSLMGFLNMCIAIIVFSVFDFSDLLPECLATLILAPFVILCNLKKNYIWASYLFHIIGIFLFAILNLKMGINSYGMLLYFPILISLIQMLGRRETFKHMIIIAIMYMISICLVLYGITQGYMLLHIDGIHLLTLKIINILLSFMTAIVLIAVITKETNAREAQINNMLREKEVLMAEVFHRVKNNMNIVTSLLNLKKHSTDSEEVQAALEDCRNRVFSMALVHQKIYSNNSSTSLNFKDYAQDLANESVYSFGGNEKVNIRIEADEIDLSLSHAIPSGLILNELLTNSFKHGRSESKKLEIAITLYKKNDYIELTVKDNGPGMPQSGGAGKDSLGMELIRSLSEQLDGKYSFENNKGLIFNLKFRN